MTRMTQRMRDWTNDQKTREHNAFAHFAVEVKKIIISVTSLKCSPMILNEQCLAKICTFIS